MEESPDWATLSPEEFAHLQKYLDYSSRKVQDVLQDFYGTGALSQHRQGECVDFEGFKLFLRSYLEADDVPDALCRHLFRSFQTSATGQPGPADGEGCAGVTAGRGIGAGPGGVSVLPPQQAAASSALTTSPATSRCWRGGAPRTSWSVSGGCAAGEGAPWSRGGRGGPPSPELSLPVTFKLYDKDGNGLLDSSEVDRIITQMMRVAQYLDWDVTELKPILQEMMREIDYDGSGTVSLAEWLRGGVTNIPLLVLLGLEGVSAGRVGQGPPARPR
uniref:EF-hand domain-containing protein n=1 Tax=Nothoprocta perdicaria TaxID=30464 RepID=A0A8C6ZGY1_NOTPE